jgi:hypothetical protein
MEAISKKLDSIPVRDVMSYKYDDMMVYISVTAFLVMGVISILILCL